MMIWLVFVSIYFKTLYLYYHLLILLTSLGACQTSVEQLIKQQLALLKQPSQQLLAWAESAEAKSAEEQERYAKQEKDHQAAIAVLQEKLDSLKEKNKELSASLKCYNSLFQGHDLLTQMMLM